MICHSERIEMLTSRAKQNSRYDKDLDIGESCYLLALINAIQSYRMSLITKEELINAQFDLRAKLEKYYQHCEIFDMHITIRNRYGEVLTEAEKSGCPVCKKLVKFFDGRNKK